MVIIQRGKTIKKQKYIEIYQELFRRKETAELIERIFISTYEKDKAQIS